MAKRRASRKFIEAGRKSYAGGKVSKRIGWRTAGDFTRCVKQAKRHGMSDPVAKGYCAKLHKATTGMWPGDRRNRRGK